MKSLCQYIEPLFYFDFYRRMIQHSCIRSASHKIISIAMRRYYIFALLVLFFLAIDRVSSKKFEHKRQIDHQSKVLHAIRGPDGAPLTFVKHSCGVIGGDNFDIPAILLGSPLFLKCCNEHDKCYGTCGAEKGKCDGDFGSCLVSSCRVTMLGTPTCLLAAAAFTIAVASGGGPAFDSAQAVCQL